jgi:pyruvate dehydrogenase E1 component alpha subunit
VDAFDSAGTQAPESVIDHVYAKWPSALAEQREWFLERAIRRAGSGAHDE